MESTNEQDPVMQIFGAFHEARQNIRPDRVASDVQDRIASALSSEYGEEASNEIAFHLSDWTHEAAFLTALHLKPEAFTDEEIRDGVDALTIHASSHLMAATHWARQPLRDVFELGLQIECE